jgi:hypothetical protein
LKGLLKAFRELSKKGLSRRHLKIFEKPLKCLLKALQRPFKTLKRPFRLHKGLWLKSAFPSHKAFEKLFKSLFDILGKTVSRLWRACKRLIKSILAS